MASGLREFGVLCLIHFWAHLDCCYLCGSAGKNCFNSQFFICSIVNDIHAFMRYFDDLL